MISIALEWWAPCWFHDKTKWWGSYGLSPYGRKGITGCAFVRLLGLELKARWTLK